MNNDERAVLKRHFVTWLALTALFVSLVGLAARFASGQDVTTDPRPPASSPPRVAIPTRVFHWWEITPLDPSRPPVVLPASIDWQPIFRVRSVGADSVRWWFRPDPLDAGEAPFVTQWHLTGSPLVRGPNRYNPTPPRLPLWSGVDKTDPLYGAFPPDPTLGD